MADSMARTLGAAVGVFLAAGVVGFGGCSPRGTHPDSAASPAAPPSAPAGPKLVLEQSQYDFGKMETNTTGRHPQEKSVQASATHRA